MRKATLRRSVQKEVSYLGNGILDVIKGGKETVADLILELVDVAEFLGQVSGFIIVIGAVLG